MKEIKVLWEIKQLKKKNGYENIKLWKSKKKKTIIGKIVEIV